MIFNYLSAILGGLLVNGYRLYIGLNNSNSKKKLLLKNLDREYWTQFIILPMMGFSLVLIYSWSNVSLSPISCLHIGATAPLIVKSLSSSVPTTKNYN